MTESKSESSLGVFERELFSRLDTIAEELRVVQQLLQEQNSRARVETVATEDVVPSASKKSRVSDDMVDRKGPEMLRLLLRTGFKTTGMRSPDLASQLGVSKDTVLRLAERLADIGLVRSVPNSGTGGRGTLIRIVNGKTEEAEQWIAYKAKPAANGSSEVHHG